MDRYTHLGTVNHAAALDTLPNLDTPVSEERMKATGTDDARAVPESSEAAPKVTDESENCLSSCLSSCLSFSERKQSTQVDDSGLSTDHDAEESENDNPHKS